MKLKTRLLSMFILICTLIGIMPMTAISAFAAGKEDATVDIESSHSSNKIGETTELTTDGYLGVPVKISVYYDKTKGAAKPGFDFDTTPVIIYVVNTMAIRTGTDSDADIIADMLSKGYAVVVVDYQNNEKAASPELDWSVQGLIADIRDGKYFSDTALLPKGNYQNTIVVPAGHNVTFNKVYFEMDKHAADGTLERIVHAWNNDFRGCFANTVIKWTRPDGTKKPTQNGFDGTAPVWYSDAKGTAEDANGQYIKIKHTKAETITDCVKSDGTPIDLNLYMHIVYPTNPVKEVPVMSMSCSSEQLASGLRTSDRPHVNGFLFDGYAITVFDHAYVPMSRNDHYGYFDGNSIQGHVTGDNISYTVELYNMQKISTAAVRYMRYLALSEPDKYKFDLDAIGVVGNSKGSIINFLGDPALQTAENKKVGYEGIADQTALDAYVDTKINSLISNFDLPGHHGESRYQNGDTTTYTKDGATVDGGELQPWITFNGEEIASGANFVYANCGGTPTLVREGYAPYFVSLHIGNGEQSGYTSQNQMVNLARQYDIPALYFESSLGHTLVGREELNYGINPYNAFKDFANFVLNNAAVKVAYTTPLDKSMDVSATGDITIKFTGMVDISEIEKITVSDGVSTATGKWTSEFGGTEWTFHPDNLNSASKYTVTVPADLKGTNGVAMGTAFTSVFSTKGEAVIESSLNNSATSLELADTDGVIEFNFTAPDMSEYNSVNANQFLLRFKVINDAANVLNVYAAASNGGADKLIGKANLKGEGYYDIDVSSYMETVAAGETVIFKVKAEKAPSVTETFKESFDSTNSFATSGRVNYELTTAPDGTSALSVKVNIKTGINGLDYYVNETQALFNNKLFKNGALSDSDYGRKFTVTFRVYDTVSRQLMMQISGRSNASSEIRDYDTPRYNFTTKANEWQTFTMEYTVYDMDYGWAGYASRAFQAYISSDGDNQSPVYFDYIKVEETVTDIKLSECSLVLANEGTKPYKAPENTENAFDVNGNKYGTFAAAVTNYTSGQTIKLLKNYTFVDSDVKDLSAFASVIIDLNGYKLTSANTSKAPIYIKAANTDTVSVTVKNGAVLVGSSALISYNDSVAAGSGKTVNIFFENVYIGLDEGSKTQKVITTNTAESGVKITSNITFTDCEIDIDQRKHADIPFIVMPGESADITLNYNMLGGSIKISSFTKTTVHESFNSLVLNKNTSGKYPALVLPNSVVLGANSYRYGNTSGSFVLPADGYGANGYTEYTIASTSYSTKYGTIPEEYWDEEKYPFVVFDEMGQATGYADLLNSSGNGALDNIREKNADYSIIMRRDFALTSQSYNIAFIYGGVTLDLQGHTLDTKGYTLFWSSGKRPKTTTFNVIDGTVIMKSAPLIAYESANNSNYNVDTHGIKTYNFIFDNISFVLNSGSKPAKLFAETKNNSTQQVKIRMDTSIILNDCELDLTNISAATTFFDIGSPNGLLHCDYQINGGNITAPSLDNVTMSNTLGENASLVFGKGSDNAFTTLTVPSSYVGATHIIPTTEGKMCFGDKLSDDGTNAVYGLTAENVTDYGVIPGNAGSPEEYPFALFAGGVYRGVYKYLVGTSADHAIQAAYSYFQTESNDTRIVLRTDYTTTSKDTSYGNWGNIIKLTIDLGGHTLNYKPNDPLFVFAIKKNDRVTNINFVNGTIDQQNKKSLILFSAVADVGQKFATWVSTSATYNVTFKDITLKLMEQNIVSEQKYYCTSAKYYMNIVFDNSTLDLTPFFDLYAAQGYAYKLFNFKSTDLADYSVANTSNNTENNNLIPSVKFIGGYIKAQSPSKVTIDPTKKADIVFEKGADGYTKYTSIDSTSAPSEVFKNEEGKTVCFKKSPVNSTELVLCAMMGNYGYFPLDHDAEKYPFAAFKNGTLLGVYEYWSDKADSAVNSAIEAAWTNLADGVEITVVLLRDYAAEQYGSYSHNQFDNFGQKIGTLTVDLNGYVLRTGRDKPLLLLQAKGSLGSKALNLNFKNGTLEAKANPLFQICTYGGDGLRIINVTLTDVTIRRGSSAWSQVNGGMIGYVSNTDSTPVKANFVLNNCVIDLAKYPPSANLTLFAMTGCTKYTTTVTINGGRILASDMSKVTIHTGEAEDSFCLGKYNDAYTVLQTNGAAPNTVFDLANGKTAVFVKGTVAGEYVLLEIPVALLRPTQIRLGLYDEIAISFRVPAENLAGYTDPVLKISFNGKTYDIAGTKLSDGSYVFTTNRISPDLAGVTLSYTLWARIDTQDVYGQTYTTSVKEYCYAALATTDGRVSDKEKTLIADTLNYCAAAQVLLKSDLPLVNEGLSAYSQYVTSTAPRINETGKAHTGTSNIKGISAGLSNGLRIRIAEITGLKLVIKDNTGVIKTITEFEAAGDADGGYFAYFTDSSAAQLRKLYTFELVDLETNETVESIKNYSFETYAYNKKNDSAVSEELKDVLNAMMTYGDSAFKFVSEK